MSSNKTPIFSDAGKVNDIKNNLQIIASRALLETLDACVCVCALHALAVGDDLPMIFQSSTHFYRTDCNYVIVRPKETRSIAMGDEKTENPLAVPRELTYTHPMDHSMAAVAWFWSYSQPK